MKGSEISRWIQMAEVKINRTISKTVTDRAKTGVCLHCESAAKKRGLCSKHYEQFRRAKAALPRREQADWEVDKIREGKVLNGLQILDIRSTNVFAERSAS